MAYYIQIRNKPFGPFNTEQLNEMKDNGKLGRSTLISENKIDWVIAESFEFLFPPQQQPTQQIHTTTQSSPTFTTPATSPTSEPSSWFYSYDGVEGYGPVTTSAIIQMIKSGTLRAESVAWQDGQFAQNISKIPQFSELFGTSQISATKNQNEIFPSKSDLFCSACGCSLVPSSNVCPSCGRSVGSLRQNFAGNSSGIKTDSTGIGYADVLKKYADFSGRARRREYWNFTICNLLIIPLLLGSIGIITIFIMTAFEATIGMKFIVAYFLLAVYLIYNILILLPSIAVCVRRLHDMGNSGWMILIPLIPVIGSIILIVFLVLDSQPGNNQYGENPKYIP
jgi:uncharacterized membrane protein YhaH (DUF805 family)